jgi:hypothetical protein
MKTPRAANVDRALQALSREVKACVKAINQQAAKLLARGRYGDSERLVAAGKAAIDFGTRVAALRADWKALRSSQPEASRSETTPLWQYFQPILDTLIALGGEATHDDLERAVGARLEQVLKAGDRLEIKPGVPRWKWAFVRARNPMIREGFLAKAKKGEWRITTEGRKAAQAGTARS